MCVEVEVEVEVEVIKNGNFNTTPYYALILSLGIIY